MERGGKGHPSSLAGAGGGLLQGRELGQFQDQSSGPPSSLGILIGGRGTGGEQAHGFQDFSKESEIQNIKSLSLKSCQLI